MKKLLVAISCAALMTTSAAAWAGPHGGHHGHGGHHAPVRVVHHHGGHHHASNLFWGALAGVAVGTIVDGVIQSYRPYQTRVTYVTPSTPSQNCVTVTNQNTGITTTQCTTM